jgi:inositol transport system substrate-binding protein
MIACYRRTLAPVEAASKHLAILASVPDVTFQFFVHIMMNRIKGEADKLGDIAVIEADRQRSSPKQSADLEAEITKGVGISPINFDALAPALREAIDAKNAVVTIGRRANISGILAHIRADNVRFVGVQMRLVGRSLDIP